MAAVEWLDAMSPWPRDGFGLDRMRVLVAELGNPQDAFPAIHVVGTNGKSTATVTIEQLLLSEGLTVGSTISPHVAGWAERIRLNGAEADFEGVVARVRPAAERLEATQFEIVTAAALVAFAEARVDAAVVEAGLGGRFDATNVLRTRVVLLTNVGLDHTDVLGDTLEAIATEKLAVAPPDSIVVLPDRTFAHLVPGREIRVGGAREAAEAFVGHAIAADTATSRSRAASSGATARSETARTIPTVRATSWSSSTATTTRSSPRSSRTRTWTRCSASFAARVPRFVATMSSSARAAPGERPRRARSRHFDHVEVVDDPVAAVARAHELGEPVLVTGSLYLLGDLAREEQRAAWRG